MGGIVASGLNINSEQFLNGSAFLNHDQNTNGYVINNGVINASTGGSVTLVGTEVVNNGVEMDLARGCSYESDLFALCFSNEEQKEGMAAFIEKRPAEWMSK